MPNKQCSATGVTDVVFVVMLAAGGVLGAAGGGTGLSPVVCACVAKRTT